VMHSSLFVDCTCVLGMFILQKLAMRNARGRGRGRGEAKRITVRSEGAPTKKKLG
jgi:hypothetical protein